MGAIGLLVSSGGSLSPGSALTVGAEAPGAGMNACAAESVVLLPGPQWATASREKNNLIFTPPVSARNGKVLCDTCDSRR